MKLILRFAFVLALSGVLPAQADIFKCVDPVSGRVTYTNSKVGEKGCSVLSRDQSVTTVPSVRSKPAPAAASPAGFPKVDAGTQKSRDGDRRQILETELANENSLLETAKKELADQEAAPISAYENKNRMRVVNRLQPFKDKVELHERNIEAIRKEINGLR